MTLRHHALCIPPNAQFVIRTQLGNRGFKLTHPVRIVFQKNDGVAAHFEYRSRRASSQPLRLLAHEAWTRPVGNVLASLGPANSRLLTGREARLAHYPLATSASGSIRSPATRRPDFPDAYRSAPRIRQ